MARHSLPRGHHVRYALPQPVTRHAVADDALAVVGSAPVRRGIAAVAVVGGALSATGALHAVTPLPRTPTNVDLPVIGLAADKKPADSGSTKTKPADSASSGSSSSSATAQPVNKQDDLAAGGVVTDYQGLARAILRASEEGRRLAGNDVNAQQQWDAAVAPAVASANAALAQGVPGATGGGTASMPGQLINTHDWYLTLPTGRQGSPDTVNGAQLATFHNQFFQLSPGRDAIMFTANAGGAHTVGSHYPRSELREMDGTQKADWNADSGTHTMDLVQAVTATPQAKPDVICGQIHDAKDDVMQIILSGKELSVRYDQNKRVVLDPNYQLGTKFETRIEATKGHIRVWYNGAQMADLPITATNSYFKAGSYVNSNPDHGESAAAIGQVAIWRAVVSHTGSGASADSGSSSSSGSGSSSSSNGSSSSGSGSSSDSGSGSTSSN